MSGQLLEPRLLMRAARQHQFALSEPRASQLSALLETSRGITLIGPRPNGLSLARLILDSAVSSGAGAGIREVGQPSIAGVRRVAGKGRGLLLVGVEVSALAGLVTELEPYLDVPGRSDRCRRPDWRALLLHEATEEK